MRKAAANTPQYRWGDIGGRGAHPADPKGDVFGKTHWPKAMPHEKGDYTGRTAGFVGEPKPVTTKTVPAPKVATTTGLITLKDFIDEAKRAGVLDKTLQEKLEVVWGKALPNPGMYQMQCNNLLRNAIKRKGQGGRDT